MIKIKTYIHDAGRTAMGFGTENNDCAVRAYAIAKEIPYYEAHELFKKAGRRDGRGSRLNMIREIFGFFEQVVGSGYGVTLTKFLTNFNKGTYFVVNRNHAFCIKNGVVFDHKRHTGKTKIYGYFEVK